MSTKASKRVRRSAEESRALILDIAQRRLAKHGLDGLNIADIAAEAGMSHGTLLHHFGSSDDMRSALANRMGERLLEQVLAIEAVSAPVDGMEDFFEQLFGQLSSGGHARLIAWLSLSRKNRSANRAIVAGTAAHFDALVQQLSQRQHEMPADEADRSARYIVLLVVSAAIGLGVARDNLLPQLALDDEDEAGFARWLARVIEQRVL